MKSALCLAAVMATMTAGSAAAAEKTGCWAADEARASGRPLGGTAPVTRLASPEGAVVARVTRTIHRPIAEVFDYIIDVDLKRIAGPKDGAPGIVSTTIPSGWNKVGQVRTNTYSNGITLREQLTRVDRPTHFAYCLDQYSLPALSAVIDRTEGAWLLTDNGDDTTDIAWTYSVVPTTAEARAQIGSPMALKGSRATLESALSIIKADLENQSSTASSAP